jgi:RimJ/RimL family protein N-acetyltransferase
MDTTNLVITTERLVLKPISLEYREDIFKEFTEEIVVFMNPSPAKDISETENFILDSLEKMKKGSDAQQVITHATTGEFLGCAGLHHINTSVPVFGIWLKKGAHGNKYGQEAMKGLKEWAEKNLEYEYLKYPVAVKNVSSRKVAESLGGRAEREFVGEKQNGEKMNEVEYRIYR